MKIRVSKNLKQLAEIFGKENPLFIVGGYVRDSLLKFKPTDIDICSSLTPGQVKSLLLKTIYKVVDKNLKLGALKIVCEKEEYEYTTFRTENYDNGGKHSPTKVIFSQSIVDDAKRRDFTINSIYYNIIENQIADFYGGIADVKTGTIKAVDDPDDKIKDDGLRILRMIRFASELNYAIEEKTFEAALKYLPNLSKISIIKKNEEFKKIILSKTKHQVKNAGYYGMRLLDKLNLWEVFGKNKNIYKHFIGLSSFLNDYEKAVKGEEILAFALDSYEYLNNLKFEKFNLKIHIENLCGENSLNLPLKEKNIIYKKVKILYEIFNNKNIANKFYSKEEKMLRELLPFIKRHSYQMYREIKQKLC